ncbi:MAG: response regulator [candidate division NC10 bacterium]|nr:response regulator [candidate division NC10 bacterium]
MATSADPGRSLRRARILVVEDNPLLRELFAVYVQTLGYEACVVPTGGAALAAVASQPPDLLLCHVGMPGLDGMEVCRRLKADPTTRAIPVLLHTGGGEESQAGWREAGADAFLRKPFSREELRARIRALLRM